MYSTWGQMEATFKPQDNFYKWAIMPTRLSNSPCTFYEGCESSLLLLIEKFLIIYDRIRELE